LQSFALLFVVIALALSPVNLEAQRAKHAPLTTRWAKDVDVTNPLPEYPRPQMVRKDWLSLNGVWQFQSGLANEPIPASPLRSKIVVPFPVESLLSGVMMHFDRLWYRRTFNVPAGWNEKRIILHFGAVDYESEVYINGKSVGTHKGGYDPFSFDITPYLAAVGPQEIVVRVFDPTDTGGQPRGKQSTNPEGIMFTPTTGIWQSVWLEPVNQLSISDVKIVPDIDRDQLRLTVNTTGPGRAAAIHVVVKDGDNVVQSFDGKADTEVSIPIPAPKLWTPETPFLYGLDISLSAGGETADQVSSYF
jgi:beta-galactosidase/beta-glucuronidase